MQYIKQHIWDFIYSIAKIFFLDKLTILTFFQQTYQLIFESCCEQGGPTADSVRFWFDFLDYMMRVIEDDKHIYTPVLNQFPQVRTVINNRRTI